MLPFFKQLFALLRKQAILSMRSPTRSVVLISQSFLVMFIVWAISQAVDLNQSSFSGQKEDRNPQSERVEKIASCRSSPHLRQPCYTLLYSSASSNSTILRELMRQIGLDPTEILQFDSPTDLDSWLLCNPTRSLSSVIFDLERDPPSFVLQVNTTAAYWKGKYRDPNKLLLSLQTAIEEAWIKLSSPKAQIKIFVQKFPHPSLSTTSVSGSVLPVFILASIMINFVCLLNDLVSEKESGMRRMMETQGLMMGPYWLSWLLPQAVQGIVHSSLLVAAARAFGFEIVILNDFSLLILLLFLCNLSLSSLAMAISCLLDHASLAIPVSMGVFLLAWIMQLVVAFGLPYGIAPSPIAIGTAVIFDALPWTLLSKGIIDLSSASAGRFHFGISWDSRDSYCWMTLPPPSVQSNLHSYWQGPNCTMSIGTIFGVLPLQCIFYLSLCLLLDLLLGRGPHSPEPAVLFSSLFGADWWRRAVGRSPQDLKRLRKAVEEISQSQEAEDLIQREVQAEMISTAQLCRSYLESPHENPFPTPGLYLCGLRKVYPRSAGPWCRFLFRCSKKEAPEIATVDSIWLGLKPGECFCLLGPNGAGKSTTIKSIIGSLRPCSGDVIVNGHSIISSASKAKATIGVCPQFDNLYDSMTVREHMGIVFDLKGVPPSSEKAGEIESLLLDLGLADKADQWAGRLSGGMRRRLSVAMAMVGHPSTLLFDEPSSGLDSISRGQLWSLIAEVKKMGKIILVTTHSMEEAEHLSDRISIMKSGRLQCLGSSTELKRLLNGGYRVRIEHTTHISWSIVEAATKRHLGVEIQPLEEGCETLQFVFPVIDQEDEIALLAFLDELHSAGVAEDRVHVSLASLEEAYLQIVSDSH